MRFAPILVLVLLALPALVGPLPASATHVAETQPVAPHGTLSTGGVRSAAAVWIGDRAYLFGGVNGTGDYLDAIVAYDPATQTATELLVKLPSPRAGVTAVAVGGKAYLFGGFVDTCGECQSYFDGVLRFDPATGVVDQVVADSGSAAHGVGIAAAVVNDMVYLFGGCDVWTSACTTAIRSYAPASPTVAPAALAATLPNTGRGGMGAAPDGSGGILLAGGEEPGRYDGVTFIAGGPRSEVFRFDPVAGTLTLQTPTLPAARAHALSLPVDGRLYLVGGSVQAVTRLDATEAVDLPWTLDVRRAAGVWTGTYGFVLGGDRSGERVSPSASVTHVSPVPVLLTAVADRGTLTLTYDRALADSLWIDPAAYTVGIRGIDFPVSSVLSSGAAVTVAFPTGIPAGDDGHVSVDANAGARPADAYGNLVLLQRDVPVDVTTPTGMLPTPRVNPVALWTGTQALVIGGNVDASCSSCATPASILSYDHATGVASTIGRFEGRCCVGGALVNGDAYVFDKTTLWRFDPDTRALTSIGALDARMRDFAVATDGTRHLYVFGGYLESGCEFECVVRCETCITSTASGHRDQVFRFDTLAASPTAEPVATLPEPRSRAAAVLHPTPVPGFPAGRAFVVGGENATGVLDAVVLVDLATGQTSNLTISLPQPVAAASAIRVGDSILALGGATADAAVATATRLFPDRPEALAPPVALSEAVAHAGALWNGASAMLFGGYRWSAETTHYPLVPIVYTPDLTSPVPGVVLVQGGSANEHGWHTSHVTVQFQATDASTIESVTGANGDGDFVLASPLALTDGEWSLRARARDAWGNVGTSLSPLVVRQDTVAPTVTVSGSEGTLSSAAASIEFAFSEPMDRASTEAALAGDDGWTLAWSADSTRLYANRTDVPVGTHTLTLGTSATDAHGVPLAVGASRSVTRDAPPPEPSPAPAPAPVTTTPSAPRDLAATPTAGGARLTWSPPASDGGSPLTGYVVRVGDARFPVAGTAYDAALAPGESRTFTVHATNANGMGDGATVVAGRAPESTVSLTPAGPDGANDWYLTAPVVTLTATPETAQILVDLGAGESAYAGPITLPPGVTTLRWRAVVPGAPAEEARALTFRHDAAAPAVAPSLSAGEAVAGDNVTLRALVTDDASGVARVLADVDGVRAEMTREGDAYVATIAPGAGAHDVAVVATDHAGRETRASAGRLVVAAPPTPPTESELDAPRDLEPTGTDEDASGTRDEPDEAGEPGLVIEQDRASLVGLDAGARGIVTIRVLGVSDAQDVVIVVVDENGDEVVLPVENGTAEWDTTLRDDGYYHVEARRGGADGLTLASERVLVRNPARTLLASTTALAAAVLLTGGLAAAASAASAGAGGTGFGSTTMQSVRQTLAAQLDILAFAQEVAVDAGQDKLRDKTKDRLAIERRQRVRSVIAAVAAATLLASLWAVSEAGGWRLRPWLAALPTVATAAFIVTVLKWSSEGSLAWVTHAAPRFRLWLTGLFSLAASVTFFHSPFGYPGFVEEVEREGDHRRRLEGVRALATVAGAAAFMLPFLALATLTPFSFVEIGLLIAITNIATSAMPFRPLPGSEVWTWSKTASIAVAATTFALYASFVAALTPMWFLWTLGVLGVATQAAVMLRFRKTLGPAARRVPVGVNVPVKDMDAQPRKETTESRR